MTNYYELPPKLDMDTMKLATSPQNKVMNTITCSCGDSDLHAWLAMRIKWCIRVCALASDLIANNAVKWLTAWSSRRL